MPLRRIPLDSYQAARAVQTFESRMRFGNFGATIGGQFVNGYEFTSAAAGQLSEIDIGIGGAGTFNLTLYTDNAGALGAPIWSTSNVPVGLGSPNPAVINVVSGPALTLSQNYWLVASGPSASAYWSPNTIGAQGTEYHHDSGSTTYATNVLGAFAVKVVPEPSSVVLAVIGLVGLVFWRGRKTQLSLPLRSVLRRRLPRRGHAVHQDSH
jgi:PEP-CTERM motif